MFFETIQAFDNTFLNIIQMLSFEPILFFLKILTDLGNPIIWVLIAAFVYWKGQEKESFYIMNLVLFSIAIAGVLKIAFARTRPNSKIFTTTNSFLEEMFPTKSSFDASFPSGHSTMIGAASSYYWKSIKKHEKKILILIILTVTISRMILGRHFLTDVLSGTIIGILIGKFVFWSKKKLAKYNFEPTLIHEIEVLIGVGAATTALFYLESLELLATFIGFYAGFFSRKKNNSKNIKHSLKKQITGFTILLIIIFTGAISTQLTKIGLYFLAGLWISIIFPWLHHKFTKKLK